MRLRKDDHKRIRELREKRMRLAQERENACSRREFGPIVVDHVNTVLGTQLRLEDFDPRTKPPMKFNYKGLVAQDINRQKTEKILACCAEILGKLGGLLELPDQLCSLGLAELQPIDLRMLVPLGEALEEPILLHPAEHSAVIFVDYYWMGMGQDYSVAVQGGALERRLQKCFTSPVTDLEASIIDADQR